MTTQTVPTDLQVIVKESGLVGSKAKYILENFQNYFEIAAEWEAKAKTLVVTNPFQKNEMAQAREGRLFLREKRLAIENSRKKMKEDVLREGKAIDGIANVLKALIEPIEAYLDSQEHFVEIENKKKEEAFRLKVEKRIAEEQAAEDKKRAEESERLHLENERLKKETAERDKKFIEEKRKQEELIAKERAKARAAADKADAEKAAIEQKAADEKLAIEEKARKQKEAIEAKARKEKELAKKKLDDEREEKERLEELLRRQIECPNCHHKFEPKGIK